MNLPHAGPYGGRLNSEIDSPTEKYLFLVDLMDIEAISSLEIHLKYRNPVFLKYSIENLKIQLKYC
tara:strand:- start:661 stop:858 length:198 start_codon:yes stop_codon:yes gene_type:complete